MYKKQRVNLENIDYLNKGDKDKDYLFFLHGFGYSPYRYNSLLEELATDYEVIAPKIYGTNNLDYHPVTINEYAHLTLDFIDSFKENKPRHVVGHSLGATSGLIAASKDKEITDVIAINPMMGIDYGLYGLTVRRIKIFFKELFGVKGEIGSTKFALKTAIPYLTYLLKDPKSSKQIIKEITKYENIGFTVEQPALILYGEDDEYYNLASKNSHKLKTIAPDLELITLRNKHHNWPIFSPKKTKIYIDDFIKK